MAVWWLCATAMAEVPVTVQLWAGSSTTNHRWMDVADQLYAESYRQSYNYTQASVNVELFTDASVLHGTVTADHLKPNFAYQLKLVGSSSDPEGKEQIGLTGRWWQSEWSGTGWTNGHNLNDKGDGSAPNPNDLLYYQRRDVLDPTSPTGKKYHFTAYRVLDYFITDENGNALFEFRADDSYHVLWKTSQRAPTAEDGPPAGRTFAVTLPDPMGAYDSAYSQTTAEIFGEWERLPRDGILLPPGDYSTSFNLTEESFHGGGLEGHWASAMSGTVGFTIVPDPLPGDLNSDRFVGGHDLDCVRMFWGQNVTPGDLSCGDASGDGFVGGDDLDEVRAHWGEGTPSLAEVPEPSAFILLTMGTLALLACMRWNRRCWQEPPN